MFPSKTPEQLRLIIAFCKSIGLRSYLVADEGINGTVSGDYETTQKYMDYVHSLPGMEDLWFKIDEEEEQAFKKMFVRYKKEIVHLGLEDDNFDNDINPLETTGAYLSPKEFKEALLDEDTVVLDTRNDYEYDLGHFRGAIRPDIRNFRELPQWVRDNKEKFMDKRLSSTVLSRSLAKFSGWMVREELQRCWSIAWRIATYREKIQKFKANCGMGKCTFLTSGLQSTSTMSIKRCRKKTGLMEHHVNVMSTVEILSVTVGCASEENEDKYLRGCS